MARWHTTEWDMLPENAFQRRGWKGSMTLEGGKGGGSSAPAADPNIGIAQREMSALASQQWSTFMGTIYPEMLSQAQQQEARADEQWAMTKDVNQFQLEQARKAYDRYEEGAIPAMDALRKDAEQYNEAGYQEMLAERAMGDVNSQFENQRQQTAMRQQAYGIDPTSGVAQGSQNASSVQQAALGAAAMNQTRQAAHDIGLQKMANVYNMYAGLPAQANASTALGLNAAGQGFNTGQSAYGNYSALGGSLNSATGTAMQGWNSVGQLGVSKYNTDVSAYNAQQQADATSSAGFGSMLGTLGSAYLNYAKTGSDIGIKQDIELIGVLPNGVNVYEFEYKPEYRDTWGHGRFRGVMAQEVEHIPGAVDIHPDGYKMVDYAKVMSHGV